MHKMQFANRVKKELTEAVTRSILVDAEYRVIDFGLESQIRELECLTALEYFGLDFPVALRSMPDLLIMDRDQTQRHLVEIKYRNGWSTDIFSEIEEQVRMFKELVLVYFNSSPQIQPDKTPSPASYLRACRLKHDGVSYQAELIHNGDVLWLPVNSLGAHDGQWWGLRPLQSIFGKIEERRQTGTLTTAIDALRGIIGPKQSGR